MPSTSDNMAQAAGNGNRIFTKVEKMVEQERILSVEIFFESLSVVDMPTCARFGRARGKTKYGITDPLLRIWTFEIRNLSAKIS